MPTLLCSFDPDGSLVDPPRMAEFQHRLTELASELGFRVVIFDVDERRLSERWPVVRIEIQQKPMAKEAV